MIDSKLIKRVKNLMAMAADGSSPHEAAIAAKRARSLMDKYQLTVEDLVESDGFGRAAVGKSRTYTPKWEQWLCISIARYNDCIVDYEVTAGAGSKLRFKGFESDVMVCKFMFYYLVENGKRLSSRYMKEEGQTRYNAALGTAFKNSYARELTKRFNELSAERRKEVLTSTGTSLMVVKQQLVNQKFGMEKYGQGRSTERRGYGADNARRAGHKAGASTSIHTGIGADSRTGIE